MLDPPTGSVQVFLIKLCLQFVAVPRDTRDLIFSIEVFALKVALEFVQGRNFMTAELEKEIYPSDCANDDKRSYGANSFEGQPAALFRVRFRLAAVPKFELFWTHGHALFFYRKLIRHKSRAI